MRKSCAVPRWLKSQDARLHAVGGPAHGQLDDGADGVGALRLDEHCRKVHAVKIPQCQKPFDVRRHVGRSDVLKVEIPQHRLGGDVERIGHAAVPDPGDGGGCPESRSRGRMEQDRPGIYPTAARVDHLPVARSAHSEVWDRLMVQTGQQDELAVFGESDLGPRLGGLCRRVARFALFGGQFGQIDLQAGVAQRLDELPQQFRLDARGPVSPGRFSPAVRRPGQQGNPPFGAVEQLPGLGGLFSAACGLGGWAEVFALLRLELIQDRSPVLVILALLPEGLHLLQRNGSHDG